MTVLVLSGDSDKQLDTLHVCGNRDIAIKVANQIPSPHITVVTYRKRHGKIQRESEVIKKTT